MTKGKQKLTDVIFDKIQCMDGWFQPRDMFHEIAKEDQSLHFGTATGNIGRYLKALWAAGDNQIGHKEVDGAHYYRWEGNPATGTSDCNSSATCVLSGGLEVISTSPIVPLTFTHKTTTDDKGLIIEALMAYANTLLPIQPQKALDCAFLAGKQSTDSVISPTVAQKPNNRVKPRSKKPDPKPPKWVGVQMPQGMTYEEFQQLARQAYADTAFTYEDVAERSGIEVGYVKRLIAGDATPTRATVEKLFTAIFNDKPY